MSMSAPHPSPLTGKKLFVRSNSNSPGVEVSVKTSATGILILCPGMSLNHSSKYSMFLGRPEPPNPPGGCSQDPRHPADAVWFTRNLPLIGVVTASPPRKIGSRSGPSSSRTAPCSQLPP
eukprot:Amastigsp_a841174_1770.p4 type:complete len:120 gc:universal Amastigsp_a841174_1770:1020-1379(+)